MKAQRDQITSRSERAKLRYRQSLFEGLTITIEQLRIAWRKFRKDFYATQRKTGRIYKVENREFNELRRKYELLMRQAMEWTPDDPVVQQFAGECKALGARDFLREARKGLEKGVRLPYPSPDVALADLTTVDLGSMGISPGQIQKTLKARGLPTRSREGIRKRLKTFSLEVKVTQRRIPRP